MKKYSDEEKENWLYGHISQLSDTIIRETLEKLCECIMELDPQMQDTTSVTFHNSKENATVTVTIPGYFPDELSEQHRQEAYEKLRGITSEEFAANSQIYSWIVTEKETHNQTVLLNDANSVEPSNLFREICKRLPKKCENSRYGFWTNGWEMIICKTQKEVNVLHNFFKAMGIDNLGTTYRTEGNWCVYPTGRYEKRSQKEPYGTMLQVDLYKCFCRLLPDADDIGSGFAVINNTVCCETAEAAEIIMSFFKEAKMQCYRYNDIIWEEK